MTFARSRKGSLLAVGVLLILSLAAAFVLFYFLESRAQIQNKGITVGGAAAGFMLISLLLRNTYFKLVSEERTLETVSDDERIRSIEEQVQQLVASKLDNFTVPAGYRSEISTEFCFGFCYPSDWKFSRYPQFVMYGSAIDAKSATTLDFARNMNVNIEDIRNRQESLHDLLDAGILLALKLLPNAQSVSADHFLLNGLAAIRSIINYVTNDGRQLSLLSIMVADRDRQKLYTASFTTTTQDFPSSKPLFDDILSTFRM
jgi:hypothetical protein